MRSSVVLPAPLRPPIQARSPRLTSRSTLSSTWRLPQRLDTLRRLSAGALASSRDAGSANSPILGPPVAIPLASTVASGYARASATVPLRLAPRDHDQAARLEVRAEG